MEDKKPSFYEFLAANSNFTKEEKKKVHPFYLAISWVIIFLINTSVVWLGWNYAVAPTLSLAHVSFLQALLIYSFAKSITRGFFTVQ